MINYLTWDEIRELQTSGLIDFQSHTVNHRDLSYLTPEQMLYELTTSKEQLAQNAGIDTRFIAYPSGGENSTVDVMAWQAGYMAGFTTRGYIEPTCREKFKLRRSSVIPPVDVIFYQNTP